MVKNRLYTRRLLAVPHSRLPTIVLLFVATWMLQARCQARRQGNDNDDNGPGMEKQDNGQWPSLCCQKHQVTI